VKRVDWWDRRSHQSQRPDCDSRQSSLSTKSKGRLMRQKVSSKPKAWPRQRAVALFDEGKRVDW